MKGHHSPEKIDIFTKYIELENLELSKNYLLTEKKDLLEIENSNEKLIINEIKISTNIVEQQSFSKNIHEYITQDQQKNIDLGLKMHGILENIDFKNLVLDDIKDEFYKQKIINFYNKLDNLENTNIYQEYEFMYEEDNICYHGIIDLMI